MNARTKLVVVGLFLCFGRSPLPVEADEVTGSGIRLGSEFSNYGSAVVSPREESWFRSVLLYLPNRVLDLVDIVRVDVGVGPAAGGVVRLTRYGQFGMRSFAPASLRVGLRGRKIPVFIERSSEFGLGPGFLDSHDREVTPAEIGVGADIAVAGAYAGVSLDEAADFLLGFLFIDFKEDDLR